MSVATDPIADMLARIRNAAKAEHSTVDIPLSRQKLEIARILRQEGYVEGFETKVPEGEGYPVIRITLKYGPNRSKTVSGMRRISRPGRRVYTKSTNLPKVLGGMGTAILSTSSGIMTNREAARAGVGGETIAYIW
ncbi:MAG: 30S ribosomal protein S8 [Actinomycetota bacterium]